MTHKEDIAKICLVEIPDALKERNKTTQDGREPQTGYRIVISFSAGDTLTDSEKTILSRITDEVKREKMKTAILKNRTQIRYSGVFNADELALTDKDGNVIKTPNDGFSDEQQDKICAKVRQYYADMDNEGVFTVITETVSALLKGTNYDGVQYLETENADGAPVKITEQSRIFFGVFADYDAAVNMLRNSLLRRIENSDLDVPETETKTAAESKENAANALNL